MSAPVVQNGGPPTPPPMVGVNRDELVNALGNAASQVAHKGSMATDGGQAKDFGAAALAYVQAIVALITPPPAPGPPQAPETPQRASQRPTGT